MEPAIIPVCVYCHQPKSKVTQERDALIAEVRNSGGRFTYPATPAEAQEACACCTPDSEYHCPRCSSVTLQFGLFEDVSFDGSDLREAAHCDHCGWTGDVEDTAPPKQPWAELQAVALAAAPRKPESRECALEIIGIPALMEVA